MQAARCNITFTQLHALSNLNRAIENTILSNLFCKSKWESKYFWKAQNMFITKQLHNFRHDANSHLLELIKKK